jgi:hypothetical protein
MGPQPLGVFEAYFRTVQRTDDIIKCIYRLACDMQALTGIVLCMVFLSAVKFRGLVRPTTTLSLKFRITLASYRPIYRKT